MTEYINQDYELQLIAELVPYEKNSRKHSPENFEQIAASIKEFNFTAPVLIDEDNGVLAGHGRIMAAELLGMDKVPCVRLTGLSTTQKKAYVIADNQLSLASEWDIDILKEELVELEQRGFDIPVIGFGSDFYEALDLGDDIAKKELSDIYTKKISTPIYEPKGAKPETHELYNCDKERELLLKIKKADIPTELKHFLVKAAGRHVQFNYENIAEYYCHCDAEVQALMRESALVIIDFDQAIEGGYVQLTEELMALSGENYSEKE